MRWIRNYVKHLLLGYKSFSRISSCIAWYFPIQYTTGRFPVACFSSSFSFVSPLFSRYNSWQNYRLTYSLNSCHSIPVNNFLECKLEIYYSNLYFLLLFQRLPISTTMVSIAFLLLGLLVTSAHSVGCPPGCVCNDDTYVVECEKSKLDVFPIALNPAIQRLVLKNNKIKTVDAALHFYRDRSNIIRIV